MTPEQVQQLGQLREQTLAPKAELELRQTLDQPLLLTHQLTPQQAQLKQKRAAEAQRKLQRKAEQDQKLEQQREDKLALQKILNLGFRKTTLKTKRKT